MMAGFRQQAEAKSPWELDPDARAGFAQAVNNNQPQMALYYVQEIFKELDTLVHDLQVEIAALTAQVTPSAARATKAKAAEATTEA